MKNIVLTGFMGTGKTAVARELSKKLSMKLVDIDSEIEAAQNMRIRDIFSRCGEKYFRDEETAMILKFSKKDSLIISTGGGAVLREENMAALRENGIIFCLDATPATILQRTSGSNDRPLLLTEDPLKKINELLDYRRPFYEKAGETVDTENKTPMQIAAEIMEIYKCRQ